MSKSPLQTWTLRALSASAFLWTLSAGAMAAGRWYDMADLLIPYYAVFGGAFLALALLTGILWVVQRRNKQESAPAVRVSK